MQRPASLWQRSPTTSWLARARLPLRDFQPEYLGEPGSGVSILCLGGWHIGSLKNDAEAIRIMHAAIDEGLTFFDNAGTTTTAARRNSWARPSPAAGATKSS